MVDNKMFFGGKQNHDVEELVQHRQSLADVMIQLMEEWEDEQKCDDIHEELISMGSEEIMEHYLEALVMRCDRDHVHLLKQIVSAMRKICFTFYHHHLFMSKLATLRPHPKALSILQAARKQINDEVGCDLVVLSAMLGCEILGADIYHSLHQLITKAPRECMLYIKLICGHYQKYPQEKHRHEKVWEWCGNFLCKEEHVHKMGMLPVMINPACRLCLKGIEYGEELGVVAQLNLQQGEDMRRIGYKLIPSHRQQILRVLKGSGGGERRLRVGLVEVLGQVLTHPAQSMDEWMWVVEEALPLFPQPSAYYLPLMKVLHRIWYQIPAMQHPSLVYHIPNFMKQCPLCTHSQWKNILKKFIHHPSDLHHLS